MGEGGGVCFVGFFFFGDAAAHSLQRHNPYPVFALALQPQGKDYVLQSWES